MGKFTDRFLGMLRLNDEYDDYEDYDDYDDYEDDYEEEIVEKPRRSSREPEEKETLKSERVRTSKRSTVNDSFDDDYDEEAPAVAPKKVQRRTSNNKVVPIRNARNNNMEVCVLKPSKFDDAREISDTLLTGRAVVLNVEGIHVDVAQRIIDFTAGACCAIHGNLQKISNYIFIVTPPSVDISGDFQDIIGDNFDISSL